MKNRLLSELAVVEISLLSFTLTYQVICSHFYQQYVYRNGCGQKALCGDVFGPRQMLQEADNLVQETHKPRRFWKTGTVSPEYNNDQPSQEEMIFTNPLIAHNIYQSTNS